MKVVRRAARQIQDAAVWWTTNRTSAPDAVRDELQAAFELLGRHPNIGATAINVALPGVRRIHLSRIQYYLYYRVRVESESVEVLAFWHTSRGAGPDL